MLSSALLQSFTTSPKKTFSFFIEAEWQITQGKKSLWKSKVIKCICIWVINSETLRKRTISLPRRTQNLAPLHKIKLSQTRFKQHYKDNMPLMLMTKTEPGSTYSPGFSIKQFLTWAQIHPPNLLVCICRNSCGGSATKYMICICKFSWKS